MKLKLVLRALVYFPRSKKFFETDSTFCNDFFIKEFKQSFTSIRANINIYTKADVISMLLL